VGILCLTAAAAVKQSAAARLELGQHHLIKFKLKFIKSRLAGSTTLLREQVQTRLYEF
jgi:hypothetical protein